MQPDGPFTRRFFLFGCFFFMEPVLKRRREAALSSGSSTNLGRRSEWACLDKWINGGKLKGGKKISVAAHFGLEVDILVQQ